MRQKKQMQLVDQKFVHKHRPENVFLSNLRRALPNHISRADWKHLMESEDLNLTLSDKLTLQEYYIPHHPSDHPPLEAMPSLDLNNRNEDYFVLHNVPHFIEASTFDNEGGFSESERVELSRFYKYHSRSGRFVLKKSVTEIDEIKILSVLQRKDIYMNDPEKIKLSKIFEKIHFISQPNLFYALMIVNPKHTFFFEHPNEHVPGMMIIEAARQILVSIFHIYGKLPLKNVQLILSELSARFYNYMEINQPVRLMAEAKEFRMNKEGYWEFLKGEVTVMQKNNIGAVFQFEGKGISDKLFNRIRQANTVKNQTSRYYPLTEFYHNATIRANDDQLNASYRLNNVSAGGFCLEMSKVLNPENYSGYSFVICFDRVGFVLGECRLAWQKDIQEKHFAGFEISQIADTDKKNLMESIKRYCYIIEDREIL